jgi:sugar O-acyltransferase (sialic acid O-acetyltransferase NeuD family)
VQELIIVAAGGLARETAEIVERLDEWNLIGFVDDAPALEGTGVAGRPVLGGLDAVQDHPAASLVIGAGKGQARRAIARRLHDLGVADSRFATLIAPDVHVPGSCSIGRGCILLSGTVLTADICLGAHVVAMPGVVLTHDDRVHDFATLCAHVMLGGNVTIGEAAYLGMGSAVREGLQVGPESVLGMGAVLLRDLPAAQAWAGVPAAPIGNGWASPGCPASVESNR